MPPLPAPGRSFVEPVRAHLVQHYHGSLRRPGPKRPRAAEEAQEASAHTSAPPWPPRVSDTAPPLDAPTQPAQQSEEEVGAASSSAAAAAASGCLPASVGTGVVADAPVAPQGLSAGGSCGESHESPPTMPAAISATVCTAGLAAAESALQPVGATPPGAAPASQPEHLGVSMGEGPSVGEGFSVGEGPSVGSVG